MAGGGGCTVTDSQLLSKSSGARCRVLNREPIESCASERSFWLLCGEMASVKSRGERAGEPGSEADTHFVTVVGDRVNRAGGASPASSM